jgi:hypothetical protein
MAGGNVGAYYARCLKAEQKRPAQPIAKLRANLAVRADPRWIVIRSTSD